MENLSNKIPWNYFKTTSTQSFWFHVSINFHKYKQEKSEYQNTLRLLKTLLIYLVTYFAFINFSVKFSEYKKTENQENNKKNIKRKYLGNMPNNRFLWVKNSLRIRKRFYGINQ